MSKQEEPSALSKILTSFVYLSLAFVLGLMFGDNMSESLYISEVLNRCAVKVDNGSTRYYEVECDTIQEHKEEFNHISSKEFKERLEK